MANQSKKVPRAALRFTVSAFEFGDNGDKAKTAPVKMVARSGEPTEHWYFGRVVHDLAGMKRHKDRLPIDYCHYSAEVLGYLNRFDVTSGDLVVSGALTPFSDGDRASEVLYKAKHGVPYEASINFGGDGIKIEELSAGQVVTVNGRQFEGPGIVIREWPLRGVAICPYGQDQNTSTQFTDGDEEVAVTVFNSTQEQTAMSEANQPAAEAAPQTPQTDAATPAAAAVDADKNKPGEGAVAPVDPNAETVTPTPPAGATQQSQSGAAGAGTAVDAEVIEVAPKDGFKQFRRRDEAQQFTATFGDTGARWFLEGKSFADAATEFIGQKDQRITALETELTSLREQLASLPRGNEATSFHAAPQGNAAPLPKGVTGAAAAVATAMTARRQPPQ